MTAFARGFSLGRWFGVSVRANLFYLIVAAFILAKVTPWDLGLATIGILFLSNLLHEIGHMVAARLSGGDGDLIFLWPLGGMLHPRPAPTRVSLVSTAVAGITVNCILCLITIPAAWSKLDAASFPIGSLPIKEIGPDWFASLSLLTFAINFKLLVLNLIPVIPQDGGHLLRAVLQPRDDESANAISLGVAMLASVLTIGVGWILTNPDTLLVTVGFVFLTHTMLLAHRWHLSLMQGESGDEGEKFLGYDFSEGYTSLERDGEDFDDEASPSLLDRWKQKREEERRQKDDAERVEAEARLDLLLDKINRDGIASLTDEERRFLERTSDRYRSRG